MKHYRQNNVEEYVSVLAQLDKAFRNLQLLQQRGLQQGSGISVTYLRAECEKLGVEVTDSVFARPEF